MIQQEQNYRVILNNCKGKELEVARYLHIITGMEEHEGRKIVSKLPIILFESLDGEVCSYIEEAFDFYGIKYKMEPVDEWYDIPEYPSKQVIALGLMVDYIGQGTDYANIARKYERIRKGVDGIMGGKVIWEFKENSISCERWIVGEAGCCIETGIT